MVSCTVVAETEFSGIRDLSRVLGLPVFLMNIYGIGKSQLDTPSNSLGALSSAVFKNIKLLNYLC